MSRKRQAASTGILKPSDLELLRHVLEITLPAGASAKEREAHACTLITLFKSGVVREDELVETFTARHLGSRATGQGEVPAEAPEPNLYLKHLPSIDISAEPRVTADRSSVRPIVTSAARTASLALKSIRGITV